ncbi:two-component system response regulator YesN [Aequitasia blattaphilus]|uniref:Stage 0 sporulation protein A homolog n=1 Tax=Aequitasia blattaphilus TaxID=2949332 RepID=A0ABT1ECZ7_9FIRM|nr:response regulator [Aequitasia blattaphilus]MCP1102842.1 response regulator [Aequitasia blattaphilus]MCR8615482.1 response regulator [Aequitasia blattaphilus]
MKVLICDDEGIVRESIQFILKKNFSDEWEIETAKNGRLAIELAESFRPDIIMMDIQMPGINGIEAMEEIRKDNKNVLFIVLTAYDKFEYSQAAIDIGVFSYLTKPINRDVLCEILRKAKKKVDERKRKIKSDLLIKEKLEAVLPLIEGGAIYSMIMDADAIYQDGLGYYELLEIEEDYGYAIVIMCGSDFHKGQLTNSIGAGIDLKKQYLKMRELIKESTNGLVSEVMANKIIVFVPCEKKEEAYENRIKIIDNIRALLRKMEKQSNLRFKAGIGTVCKRNHMQESYSEATQTLHQGVGKVTHAKDLPVSCLYEEDYPIDLEKELFQAIERGNAEDTRELSEKYMYWIESKMPNLNHTVRLKVIEFILWAERLAYMQGSMVYRLDNREGYMEKLLSFYTYQEITLWFTNKMGDAAGHIAMKQQEKTGNVVEKAKEHIRNHFAEELSLDYIAKEIGISPYYLSKLFKECEGVNYIEYVTELRMDYAKDALQNSDKSIKEICHDSGYSDPNYFSRIFKKWTGKTPTDYREKRADE